MEEKEKCEYFEVKKIENDDDHIFLKDKIDWCRLLKDTCQFDGNEDVCPFRTGIFY